MDCDWIWIGLSIHFESGFGFGLTIINLQRIWIGLTIQKNWIEQHPGSILFSATIYQSPNLLIHHQIFN